EPASGTRFDDPVAAARSFAVDFVGFPEPVVGAFLAGDSRSGEVPVQATEQGPVTTVLVRQLADDGSWWVIGSATPNIEVDAPSWLTAIDSPLHLAGRARAFEGTVNVEIRADGQKGPLVQDF